MHKIQNCSSILKKALFFFFFFTCEIWTVQVLRNRNVLDLGCVRTGIHVSQIWQRWWRVGQESFWLRSSHLWWIPGSFASCSSTSVASEKVFRGGSGYCYCKSYQDLKTLQNSMQQSWPCMFWRAIWLKAATWTSIRLAFRALDSRSRNWSLTWKCLKLLS